MLLKTDLKQKVQNSIVRVITHKVVYSDKNAQRVNKATLEQSFYILLELNDFLKTSVTKIHTVISRPNTKKKTQMTIGNEGGRKFKWYNCNFLFNSKKDSKGRIEDTANSTVIAIKTALSKITLNINRLNIPHQKLRLQD